jgi:hypothetical protein
MGTGMRFLYVNMSGTESWKSLDERMIGIPT